VVFVVHYFSAPYIENSVITTYNHNAFLYAKLKKEGFSMRSQKLLIVFVLCLLLSVVVSAHPGGTDSQGGHIDHSTGKYHYHHGYSAHQHYDMDGDGKSDCPYLFDDKTNSSGNKTESSTKDTEPVKNGNSKKSKDYSWLFPILGCFVLYGVVLLIGELKWRFKK
jgi:hypothetical protein